VSSTNQGRDVRRRCEMPLSSYSATSLSSFQRAGQRAGLVADAFHQAAVAQEHVGVVVDDRRGRRG
jgi:transposase